LLAHWRYVFPDDTLENRTARFRSHEYRDTLPIAWVAHEGDLALGTAALRAVDLEDRDDLGPWLGGLYVVPHARRQGIASELCRVAECRAWELNFPKLYLFTLGHDAFYSRLGWHHLESVAGYGYQGSVMSKTPQRNQQGRAVDPREGPR